MQTKIYKIDDKSIELAKESLSSSGVVASPTETVYGLGAIGTDSQAVQKIFEIKGNQFLGMKVVMFGQEVELIRQLVWYEIFLSLLVIVPGLMCGAIGGLIAGILGFTTFTLMRKLEKWPAKVGVALAILVAEVVLLFVVGWLVLKIFQPIF